MPKRIANFDTTDVDIVSEPIPKKKRSWKSRIEESEDFENKMKEAATLKARVNKTKDRCSLFKTGSRVIINLYPDTVSAWVADDVAKTLEGTVVQKLYHFMSIKTDKYTTSVSYIDIDDVNLVA